MLRYFLAVLFGCISITVMNEAFDSSFDKVASTSLFGCIMSVANEDESLGPVIHKGMNRFCGACVGGFCGMYVCMYVRMYVCMYVCMYACMHVCMHVCK